MSESEPDYLSVEDLIEIAHGVMSAVVIGDAGLLESAAARPRTTVFGEDAYPRLVDKAAALMHSLARNHALADGNKRLAWSATRVFLILNGHDLELDVDDAEQFVLGVAAGDLDVAAIASVIESHLVTPA